MNGLHCDDQGLIQPVAGAEVVWKREVEEKIRANFDAAMADARRMVKLHVDRGVYDEKTAGLVLGDVESALAAIFGLERSEG